jgi:hypothetical protein
MLRKFPFLDVQTIAEYDGNVETFMDSMKERNIIEWRCGEREV